MKGRKNQDGKISENDILFPTEMFEDEVRKILGKQKEFYPQLTDESIDKIFDIIFQGEISKMDQEILMMKTDHIRALLIR